MRALIEPGEKRGKKKSGHPYADTDAIEITDSSFASGSLQRTSYARPGKLFTANAELFEGTAGKLKEEVRGKIVEGIVRLLRAGEQKTQKGHARGPRSGAFGPRRFTTLNTRCFG